MKRSSQTQLIAILLLAACGQTNMAYDKACSKPPPGFRTERDGRGHLRPYLSIEISDQGWLTWAGTPISDNQLGSLVREAGQLNPQPLLVLEVGPSTPCDRVDVVRKIVASAPICREDHRCSEGRNPENWREVGGP